MKWALSLLSCRGIYSYLASRGGKQPSARWLWGPWLTPRWPPQDPTPPTVRKEQITSGWKVLQAASSQGRLYEEIDVGWIIGLILLDFTMVNLVPKKGFCPPRNIVLLLIAMVSKGVKLLVQKKFVDKGPTWLQFVTQIHTHSSSSMHIHTDMHAHRFCLQTLTNYLLCQDSTLRN